MSALGQKRTFAVQKRMSALCQKRTSERLTKKDPRAVMPRLLRKFGIEKDVERSDLSVVNNDDIQSGVVWGLAFRA